MPGEKSVVDNPATLVWAVRLLYLECAGLAALTVFLIIQTVRSGAISIAVALALIVMSALGAVAVFFLARAMGRRARGSRGPAIVVQLFTIAAGGFFVQVRPVWAGVLLIALGVVTAALIVSPPSTRALGVD